MEIQLKVKFKILIIIALSNLLSENGSDPGVTFYFTHMCIQKNTWF